MLPIADTAVTTVLKNLALQKNTFQSIPGSDVEFFP